MLVFTADEEAGGDVRRQWLAEQGMLAADAAIIGEPSGVAHDWEAIRLVSRGVVIFRVDGHGHADALEPLRSAARRVNANVRWRGSIDPDRGEAPTMLRYPAASAGAERADLQPRRSSRGRRRLRASCPAAPVPLRHPRLLPGMTPSEIGGPGGVPGRAGRRQPALDGDARARDWLPPCEIEPTIPSSCALAAAAAEVLGEARRSRVFPGGTDAPHFSGAGIPTVPSFGPGLLTAAHRPNESISVQSIVEDATAIYAPAARRYLDG